MGSHVHPGPTHGRCGWRVRNAFSHGGLVHFQNAKQSPVQWRGLTLSPTDNGTRLLRDRLNEVDLVVLVLDMEEDLHGPLQQVPDDV